MPASPATSPNLGIPRFSNDVPADFSTDVNSVVDVIDGNAHVVTALPTVGPSGSGSLVNGQQCYFRAGSNGELWHLRYNASGGTYKWEFLGGSDLFVAGGASILTTTDAALDVPISLTIPLNGDYDWQYGAQISTNIAGGDNGWGQVQPHITGIPSAFQSLSPTTSSVALYASPMMSHRTTGLTAATIQMYGQKSSLNSVVCGNAWMRARPVRVG